MAVEDPSARVILVLTLLRDVAVRHSAGGVSQRRHFIDALREDAQCLLEAHNPNCKPLQDDIADNSEALDRIWDQPAGTVANQGLLFASSELTVAHLPDWLLLRIILRTAVNWLEKEEERSPYSHLPGRKPLNTALHLLGMPEWEISYTWEELIAEAQERLTWQRQEGRERLYRLSKSL